MDGVQEVGRQTGLISRPMMIIDGQDLTGTMWSQDLMSFGTNKCTQQERKVVAQLELGCGGHWQSMIGGFGEEGHEQSKETDVFELAQ